MFRTPYPLPTIPPEFANMKRSEMPEPYKSEIDDYIAINKVLMESQSAAAKRAIIGIVALTGVFLVAVAAALVIVVR